MSAQRRRALNRVGVELARPETDPTHRLAMTQLGNGLFYAQHHEDALIVGEAELSMMKRLSMSAGQMFIAQGNLASTYHKLGRLEEARNLYRDVYSGELKLYGAEHASTLLAANNYASALNDLKYFKEAKALLRKTIPIARRVLGEGNELGLGMRMNYAVALYRDPSATLDDLREAVSTFEDMEPIARRVLGSAHPLTSSIEGALRQTRGAVSACETAAA